MKPLSKLPSLREALIHLHKDLFLIDRKILRWADYLPDLSNFEKLVLVLEDRRFLKHRGVDFKASIRETLKFLTFRKHGGASTIDMQFVRTVTGYKDYTLKRKCYEILLSLLINFRYSKPVILSSYLNCAFFGSHLIGMSAASMGVFNKRSNDLTDDEASQIAAMLVYPKPLKPKDGWLPKIRRRADYGLSRVIRFKESFKKIPS